MKNRIQRHYARLQKENGGHLRDVAALAGVSVASISRIVSGKFSPSVAQVQALALELGKEAGAQLLVDFFCDLIPKGLRRQIRLEVVSNNTRCLSSERIPGSLELLPAHGQQMIERLVQLCLENSEVLEMFANEVDVLFDPNPLQEKTKPGVAAS
jgi:transcriptional regulator with XRE-family HTH domain